MNLKNRLSKLEKRHKPAPKLVVIFPTDTSDQASQKRAAAAADPDAVLITVRQDR